MATLTFKEAFSIQKQHLHQWQAILTPAAYDYLLARVKDYEITHDYATAYDVLRGCALDEIVHNIKHL